LISAHALSVGAVRATNERAFRLVPGVGGGGLDWIWFDWVARLRLPLF
jgi:hypothetical protein